MAENFKPCSVDGCKRNAHRSATGCKGYCNAHYKRWKRYGDPLATAAVTPAGYPMRFVHDVALKYDGADCLFWPFGGNGHGYGRILVNGKSAGAHRYICELSHGEPPTPDHDAAHSCGNGHLGCVNPGHLSWKTRTQNMADTIIHGTINRGERCGSAKLSEDDVKKIRRLKGTKLQADLASQYGVKPNTISVIQSGKTWSWLD